MLVLIILVIAYLAFVVSAETNREISFTGAFIVLSITVIEFVVNLIMFIFALIKAIFFGGAKNHGN